MNQKKARKLRKMAGYDPGEDPILNRKHRKLVTVKKIGQQRMRTGEMKVNDGPRLIYRQLKKLYKEKQI